LARKEGQRYVGRGGDKLKAAIDEFGLALRGVMAADFGCNVGGFTDCLLQEGAARVYAVDAGYGALEWKLRTDERVIVMERTNAMHVQLPEPAEVIAVDVAWTRQHHILPSALRQLTPSGLVLSLFKPQYEADPSQVRRGIVMSEEFQPVLEATLAGLAAQGIPVRQVVQLPRTERSKNPEAFLHIVGADCHASAPGGGPG
jgi:23S rRNA (cytidine1920-2'-O)/16S rRNA (cytidine1409-2'-O)-methyltransferase